MRFWGWLDGDVSAGRGGWDGLEGEERAVGGLVQCFHDVNN